MNTLKLYVWENVLNSWGDGIMFALAHDVEQARELIRLRAGNGLSGSIGKLNADLEWEPRVVESPEGFVVWGGGE